MNYKLVFRIFNGFILVLASLSFTLPASTVSTGVDAPVQTCNYQQKVLANVPIAYWRLGEASGTTADNLGSLGDAVDGDYQTGITLGAGSLVVGDADTAADFDGIAGHVRIPSHNDINTGGPYSAKTFELWFKADALTGKQLLYEEGGTKNGFNIYLDDDTLIAGAWGSNTGAWVSTTVVTDTTYHVALVYDGSTQMVTGYLDGVSFGSEDTGHTTIGEHPGLIAIGSVIENTRWNNSEITGIPGYFFNGVIDEVALYNSVLMESTISEHAEGCVCYGLTLGHTGQGNDPVASPSNSIGCTAGEYLFGESIELSGAAPDIGWQIGSWYGTDNDISTTITNTVTMPASALLAGVNYTGICYGLTLGHTGQGSDPIASPSNSIGCIAGEYVYGETIELSGATPDTGWQIESWYGTDDDISTTISNTVTMPASALLAGVNYTEICYGLTLGHTGQGSDPIASPSNSIGCSAGEYVYGEMIELSGAMPDADWQIESWYGTMNNISTTITNTVTMPASALLTGVNYTEICNALTLGHTGQGSDPIASPTNSIGCSAGEYMLGETIELSGAAPDTDWQIGSWYGTDDDISTTITNTVTMPAKPHSAGINYTEICYGLTLGHTGQGSDPIASPTNSIGCTAGEYLFGESIELSGAMPDADWQIESWYGTMNNISTTITNTVTMPASALLAGVNYTEICNGLTLGHTGQGSDPIASPTNSIGCTAGEYMLGETIELSGAAPDIGWQIGSWYGTDDDISTTITNTVEMPAKPRSAGISYIQQQYDVTITVVGQGVVNNVPGNPYTYGQTATLEPVPATGWSFAGWSGPNKNELSDNKNGTWSLTVDGDKAVTATFIYRIFVPVIFKNQ